MTPSRSEDLKIETSESPKGARVYTLTGPLTLRTLLSFRRCRVPITPRP